MNGRKSLNICKYCIPRIFWVSAVNNKPYILSVTLAIGDILLMTSYDDICPKVIHTGLTG